MSNPKAVLRHKRKQRLDQAMSFLPMVKGLLQFSGIIVEINGNGNQWEFSWNSVCIMRYFPADAYTLSRQNGATGPMNVKISCRGACKAQKQVLAILRKCETQS